MSTFSFKRLERKCKVISDSQWCNEKLDRKIYVMKNFWLQRIRFKLCNYMKPPKKS